jgi:hypothetical protein
MDLSEDEEEVEEHRLKQLNRKSETLKHNLSNDEERKNEMDVRRSAEYSSGKSYTAQLPRPSLVSGSITSRSNFITPSGNKNLHDFINRGTADSSKNAYATSGENAQSATKPPTFRNSHHNPRPCMVERYKVNQPNKSLERNNSFDGAMFRHSRNKTGLASTQSLKNMSKFMEHNSFRDNDDSELFHAQQSVLQCLDNLKK